MVITTMLRSLRETGSILNVTQWDLFTENIGELALSDLLMAASLYACLGLQLLFKNNVLRWHYSGMVIQSVFQMAWLAHWIGSICSF
jgi:sterol O-acyltransferase